MAIVAGVVGRGHGSPVSLDGVERVLRRHGGTTAELSGPALELVVRDHVDAGTAISVRRDGSGSVALAVLADATLYGAAGLARCLGAGADASAADLVLAAYERWGDRAPEHLAGRFAFVVVDRRPGRQHGVLLATDHQGSRPLSFHVDEDRIAFCSLALPLADVAGVGHRLDRERIAELVALAFGGPKSVIRGVEHVMPGSCVWVSDRGISRTRWWRPSECTIEDLGSTEAHAVRLREVFDTAVADVIDGVGSLGVMLSGGLDSTAVAATAARSRPEDRIRTYTSVPPVQWSGSLPQGWDGDERHLVRTLVDTHPNLEPTWIEASGVGLFDRLESHWELGTPPERNTTNYMWIHAVSEEAAADGVELMLTGAHGNRFFSADGPCWLVDLARRGRLVQLGREVRAWSSSTDRTMSSVVRSELIGPAVPRWMRARRGTSIDERVARWFDATAIAEHRREHLDLPGLVPALARRDRCWWTRDVSSAFDTAPSASQSHAVTRSLFRFDTVDPTSDRRVVEVALSQPERWRRHRGMDRAIARRAMSD